MNEQVKTNLENIISTLSLTMQEQVILTDWCRRAEKKQALERTDKAISQMVKEAKKINFHTVAEAAGVSVPLQTRFN